MELGKWLFLILLAGAGFSVTAQEKTAPIGWRPTPAVGHSKANKGTALALPFFEDFTGYSQFPNSTNWADSQVYINNTMPLGQISRGVATFDALNQHGRPYDTTNASASLFADSLTSKPFDLSGFVPGDSIYLSFFYQPQGNGFAPEHDDSLVLLFFNENNNWIRIWSDTGRTVGAFQQVMIPVTDTTYLYNAFRFRFVNRASIGISDDVWNLDYIRMNSGRNLFDTAVNDIAFTTPPANLLNDYTSMPYRQFIANSDIERAIDIPASLRNNYSTAQSTDVSFNASDLATGTPLGSWASGALSIPAYTTISVTPPAYTATVPSPGTYDRVVFLNQYALTSPASEPKENDTIVHQQIFDNYLAYDDGSAEQSYYLNLFATLPGKVAIEYHLNQSDSLKGFAIYFGQTVPPSTNKIFSMAVYDELAGVNGGLSDHVLLFEDFFQPYFADSANGFSYYTFANPISLPSGVFYMGPIQPAASGSDSLYYGLDRNRVTGNHVYYNVDNTWQGSLIGGAVMLRPYLGVSPPTAIDDAVASTDESWSFGPQPAIDQVTIHASGCDRYIIMDMQGRICRQGSLDETISIDISSLIPGAYILRCGNGSAWTSAKKLIKQ